MTIAITQGKALNAAGEWQDFERILIEDGRITALERAGEPAKDVRVAHSIDAQGMLLFPSLTDLNCHLQEPGSSRNGNIESETAAAVAGGFGTVCSRPDTSPVNDSKAITKLIVDAAEAKGHCRVLPLGALTKGLEGENLSNYKALKDAGCVALSSAFKPLQSLLIAQRCFEYAATHELCVMINPIEASLHQGSMHEGELSSVTGLQGVPSIAETIAVAQLIQLAQATGAQLHLSQLSCAGSVAQVKQAKANGLAISADVSLANLLYTDQQVGYYKSLFHCMPPLRSEQDRLALIQGVVDGSIDAISSGHHPLEAAEKQTPFAESTPGMSLLEVVLPSAQSLVKEGLSLSRFIDAMTNGPAKILKREATSIAPGQVADLCLFKPDDSYTLKQAELKSRGENNPLLGAKLTGRVHATFIAGSIAYQA